MSEQTPVQETTTAPEASTVPTTPDVCDEQVACDIATGKAKADPAEAGHRIAGAKKDLNCKGRGPEWYRMVYRGGWQYVSDDRLPRGSFRASERRATVYGLVYTGEIVARHDRGAAVDTVWLVSATADADGTRLVECPFTKRRDGNLGITLPDGSLVVLADPRR